MTFPKSDADAPAGHPERYPGWPTTPSTRRAYSWATATTTSTASSRSPSATGSPTHRSTIAVCALRPVAGEGRRLGHRREHRSPHGPRDRPALPRHAGSRPGVEQPPPLAARVQARLTAARRRETGALRARPAHFSYWDERRDRFAIATAATGYGGELVPRHSGAGSGEPRPYLRAAERRLTRGGGAGDAGHPATDPATTMTATTRTATPRTRTHLAVERPRYRDAARPRTISGCRNGGLRLDYMRRRGFSRAA